MSLSTTEIHISVPILIFFPSQNQTRFPSFSFTDFQLILFQLFFLRISPTIRLLEFLFYRFFSRCACHLVIWNLSVLAFHNCDICQRALKGLRISRCANCLRYLGHPSTHIKGSQYSVRYDICFYWPYNWENVKSFNKMHCRLNQSPIHNNFSPLKFGQEVNIWSYDVHPPCLFPRLSKFPVHIVLVLI